MKASLKNYRQSPRKVRHAGDLIKGKKVEEALLLLEHTPRKATEALTKLVRSAVANAENKDGANEADLYVKNVRVDKGMVMKRIRPRAYGRAFPIRKRTSHIAVELATGGSEAVAESKKTEKAEGKPKAAAKKKETKTKEAKK